MAEGEVAYVPEREVVDWILVVFLQPGPRDASSGTVTCVSRA
jgi:hypothetical protein